MKTINLFSSLLDNLFSERIISGNVISKTKKSHLYSKVFMLFILFATVQVKANTYFDPTNTNHLNVTVPTTIPEKYCYVDFRVLTYDVNGEDDRMLKMDVRYIRGPKDTVLVLIHGAGDKTPILNWIPVNTIVAGYFVKLGDDNSGGIYYSKYRWFYPQSLIGQTVNLSFKSDWDLNWYYSGDRIHYYRTYNNLKITLPSFTPTPITNPLLQVIDGTSDSKWFNFSWTSYDATNGTTKLELYNSADYSTKIYSSTITNGNAGNVNIPLGLLNTKNTVWPKLVYTITSTYPETKIYECNMAAVSVAGFTYPKISSVTFNSCTKTTTLNWTNTDPTLLDPKSKTYIYRKSNNLYTLLTPSGLAKNILSYNDADAALVWDTQYTYIVRTCPDYLTPSTVSFTNATAATYLPELLSLSTVVTGRQKIDFSNFMATPIITGNTGNITLTWKATWCTDNPKYLTLLRTNDKNSSDIVSVQVLGNTLKYVDATANTLTPYKYCLIADNAGRNDSSAWKSAKIIDQCKFKSMTATKGVLNDRVRLSWEIDKALSNKYIIYRKVYDNNSTLFDYEMIGEKQTSNTIDTYEDLSVSPGILYKYKVVSYYATVTDTIYVNTADSVGLGFSQPIGTISGNVAFGSGTAVEGVNVSVENTDTDQKLYKSLEFNTSDAGKGGTIRFNKPLKHGCIANGFTWQAWVKAPNRSQVNATIYEMKDEYAVRINADRINVFINGNSITVPLISSDISSISSNKFFQLSVSYNKSSKYLRLYKNGVSTDSAYVSNTYTCANTVEAKLASSYQTGGINFLGNVDEMRLWNRALTSTEISLNFDRYLSGSETDLVGYWQMDEGINIFAFDKSNISKSYNENHISLVGGACSDSVPTLAQLSIKSTTDKNGNYLIQGVPYRGNGSTYNVIPALGTHEFEPSSQQLFIGGVSSEVQSKISFKDISSFTVSGQIFYENTNYPVADVQFAVDGSTCTRDNQLVVTDTDGKYEIDVPIGEHKITLFKNGHTFVNAFTDATLIMGQTYNFKENKTNIDFNDLTKVTLVGRVVGGAIQAAKQIGFNRSTANIGQAKVKLQPKLGQKYQLNYFSTDSLVLGNGNSNIFSTAKVAKGSDIINITTDSTNGEFLVMVPPIPMKITDVQAIGIDKSYFKLENQPYIDMMPLFTSVDTIHYGTKIIDNKSVILIDSCVYNQKLNLTYLTPTPVFTINDLTYTCEAYGDTLFYYTDPNNALNNDTIPLVSATNGVVSYKMNNPVFTQGNNYYFKVHAYEKYVHPKSKVEDIVPLSGMPFEIENKLGANSIITEYLLDSLGMYTYKFMAGNPVLIGDHTMGMTATMQYNGSTVNWMNGTETGLRGIVLGAVPAGGVDFVTKGPDQVIAVLRDPPGSNSYATLEKGSTFTNTRSYKGIGTESTGHKFTANLGGEVSLVTGIGVATTVETANKNDLGIGIEQSVTGSDATSRVESFSISESISTSSSPSYVGANGDVYIANSTNIGFAKCTQLNLKPTANTLSFNSSDSYIFVPMGDSTSFRYTQNHIVTQLIPGLKNLRKSILKTVVNTDQYTKGSRSIYLTTLDSENSNFGQPNTYVWIPPLIEPMLMIDSVTFYTNQINHWENIIRRNEMEKLWASDKSPIGNTSSIKYDRTNLSFDAGTVLSKSITRTSSCETTNEVEWNLNFAASIESGLTVNKFGFTLNNEVKTGGGEVKTTSSSTENTITYSYTLEDGDDGNYFSVDVFTPQSQTIPAKPKTNFNKAVPSYVVSTVEHEGGPIFVTRGGATSCPYEKGDSTICYVNASNKPEALSTPTVQIEKPGLEVLIPTVGGISSGKQASFELVLQNLSSSSTASWFQLSVDPASNPYGAIISIDGTPLTEPRLFLVTSTPMHKIARISQSSTDDLNFENLRFDLSSPCQSDITATAYVTANFVPSCSDLTLQIDDRTLNSETGSDLTVVLKDFDKSYKNFGGIRLQYKGVNELNWSLAKEFVLDSTIMKPSKGFTKIGLDDVTLTYKFPMETDPDQTYQFRARTACTGDIYNESDIITVVKDMKRPLSMGLPSPSNGILTPETEISVTFNESIQAEKIASTDIKVYGVLNGFTETDNVGLTFDGTQKAFTELPLNLQSSSFTIEGKFLANSGNTAGTIFSVGEGADKIALQMVGNDLKVIAGNDFSKQTALNADASFQYFALSYDAVNKTLAMMLWSNGNKTKMTLFTETLSNGIAPVGRLIIGENFNGSLRQISVWNEQRTYGTITESRSVSKTGKELNLAGYWAMDEGYGTLAVDKARGRNLTIGSSWFITPMGLAATLNGTNQIVAKSGHIPLTTENDFGMEFWFKGATGQKNATLYSCVYDTIASKNLSVAFNIDGNLTLATNGNSYLIPSGSVLDDTWHHFALSVMRGGNANVYIDGASKYQTSATNIGGMESDSITFGALRSYVNGATKATISNRFTGSIDEVRVWNNALTTENVNLNMHSKLAGTETGLNAYYPFEKFNSSDDVVSSLTDASIPASVLVSNGGIATGNNVSFTNNTAAIKVTRPRTLVNSSFTASDNKIIININEDADMIENCVLEFEMERIMDLNSNRMASPLKWTAFVNMNRLKWETESVDLTKEVLNPLTFNAVIANSSGKYENYVITGLPSWLSVNKTQGTLSPLNKTTLVFTVDKSTNVGSYECDIRLTGSKNIDEILPVILKVTGPRPDWSVNPYDYESSMNVIGQIKIEGVYQEDPEDMLAAFKGTKCIGIASPQFDKTKNGYILYMDIYGNSADNGQALTFSLWDAGTGRIYPGVDVVGSSINYISSNIVGSILTPQIFNATDKVEQQLTLKQGWNWISTNVTNTQPTLINQFKIGMEAAGIQLKSRTGYIDYANSTWVGNDFDLNQTAMYMLKTNQAKTLKIVGATAKPADFAMVINPLWNWIGYVPQFVTPVKDALAGLAVSDGDQIKSQIGFASYSNGAWYGSLQYMLPGLGYMYKSMNSAATVFNYPSQYFASSKISKQDENTYPMKWVVDQNKYQMSMTVTGAVSIDNTEVTNSNMQVAVFVGDECRGISTLKYVDTYQRHMAFLMIWGNSEDVNSKITFRSFDPTNNQEMTSAESLSFVPDNITGSPANPYKINYIISRTDNVNLNSLKVYPNPVIDILHFVSTTDMIEEIEIVDNLGRVLMSDYKLNKNVLHVDKLVPGIYTLRIKSNGKINNQLFIKK
jgi:hypothetical protein